MKAILAPILQICLMVVFGLIARTEAASDTSKKVSWMDSKRKIVVGKKTASHKPTEVLETLSKKRGIASQYLEQITNNDCRAIADASLKNMDHIIEVAKKSKEKSLKKYVQLANEELGAIKFVKKFKAEKIKKDLPPEAAEMLIKHMDEVKATLSKQAQDPLYTEVLLPNAERQLTALRSVKDKVAKFLGTKVLLRKIHGFENSAIFNHVK